MKLNINLLNNIENSSKFESSLNGTRAKGSYSTMQFAIRLRDDIREALNSTEESYERTQAFSTFLHENIHWWQHVGSNFGFIYSLTYPAITTSVVPELKKLIEKGIISKPLIRFDKEYYEKHKKADIDELNRVLNTYFDIEYAKFFALDNKNIKDIIKDRRFFLSIGHCYHIMWSSSIHSLESIDVDNKFLPNINEWVPKFQKLKNDEIDGFGIDTQIGISELGIKAIYEGQAIFNQLQYLSISLDGNLTIEDCEKAGMLYGIYNEAFLYFIEKTGLEKPEKFINSEIGLFLLVCDIAINPTNGFPFDVYDFENFITINDPGQRFAIMCKRIGEDKKGFTNIIKEYSKDEYIEISEKLSDFVGSISPYKNGELIQKWITYEPEIKKLLQEESDNKFNNENQPMRLFFSKYLRFQEDKYKEPNVFCWIGYHLTSRNKNTELKQVSQLFNKHKALFIDAPDNEIKPTIFEHLDDENTIYTFNQFYQYNIQYDTILKWIYEEGEYTFDFSWLTNKKGKDFIEPIKKEFKRLFNFSIDNLETK